MRPFWEKLPQQISVCRTFKRAVGEWELSVDTGF